MLKIFSQVVLVSGPYTPAVPGTFPKQVKKPDVLIEAAIGQPVRGRFFGVPEKLRFQVTVFGGSRNCAPVKSAPVNRIQLFPAAPALNYPVRVPDFTKAIPILDSIEIRIIIRSVLLVVLVAVFIGVFLGQPAVSAANTHGMMGIDGKMQRRLSG